ncbi:MAG: hypothetical protein BYD32DRAFT_455062 [Podila humilis]|nr:MAG: hypothetical protein BYD32DRAFT_455062 [Podila humilis]
MCTSTVETDRTDPMASHPSFYYYRYFHACSRCHLSVHTIHPCAYLTCISLLLLIFLGQTRCLHLQCHLKSLFFYYYFRFSEWTGRNGSNCTKLARYDTALCVRFASFALVMSLATMCHETKLVFIACPFSLFHFHFLGSQSPSLLITRSPAHHAHIPLSAEQIIK